MTQEISPGHLDAGAVLADDNGRAFATVRTTPVVDPETNSVWVDTDFVAIEFPPGTLARVLV